MSEVKFGRMFFFICINISLIGKVFSTENINNNISAIMTRLEACENAMRQLLAQSNVPAARNYALVHNYHLYLDSELLALDFSDWTLIESLGRYRYFSNRQTDLLIYALRRKWGDALYTNITYLNKLYGLICGFQPRIIESIRPDLFVRIKSPRFNYLFACSDEKLESLLKVALSLKCYGPIQLWTAENLSDLGMIVKALKPIQFEEIRPTAMQEFDQGTMKVLDRRQLESLSKTQFDNLNRLAQTLYIKRMGMPISSAWKLNNYSYNGYCWIELWAIVIVWPLLHLLFTLLFL